MLIKHLNPDAMYRSEVFSQGTVIPANSTIVIVGGQNGVGPDGQVVSDKIGPQSEQAMRNLLAVLAEVGADQTNVAKLTIYLVEGVDVNEAFAGSQPVWGEHVTAVSSIFVRALARPECLVEVEGIAALPA